MKKILMITLFLMSSLSFASLEELKKDKRGYEKLMSEINSMQVELDPGADYTIVGKYKIRKMGKSLLVYSITFINHWRFLTLV